MTKYNLQGSSVYFASDLDLNIVDKLPANVYEVAQNPLSGEYYLKVGSMFDLPKKLYGDAGKRSERILRTYEDRDGTTGVLLTGLKGSGKSLTVKLTAVKALEKGFPVILVNAPHCGTAFNAFIASIDQPCVLLFDEFEKVYDDKAQQALLTLLDGVYSTKKLFMMTVNESWRINGYMNNRPGRMYYNIEYKGLTPEFIREYCEDTLTEQNKSQIDKIILYSSMFGEFNFDMLKAICEELNRYNEKFSELLDILNIRHDGSSPQYALSAFKMNGEEYPVDCFGQIGFSVPLLSVSDDEDGDGYEVALFLAPHLDADGNTIPVYRRRYKDGRDPTLHIQLDPMATKNVEKNNDMSQYVFKFPEHDLVVVAQRKVEYKPKYYNMF